MGIKDKNLIPLIYKDYGRSRGCGDSAKAFKKYIEEISNTESLNIKPLLIEVNDLPRWINTKFGNIQFKDLILFSICFIQNPEQRGFYDFIKTKKDVVFCKRVLDKEIDYIQNVYTIEKLGEDPSRHFPKFYGKFLYKEYRPGNRVEKIGEEIKIDINYCWYDRSDTSPIQSMVYNTIGLMLKLKGYSVESFGFKNDIPIEDVIKRNDVILYTAPDHLDPFPNTIFQAVINNLAVIELPNENTGVTDPGFQMIKDYFPHKVYSLEEWSKYITTDFKEFAEKNHNRNISNLERYSKVATGTVYQNPKNIGDYNKRMWWKLIEETTNRIKKHIIKVKKGL